MADKAVTIKLKNSATPGAVPAAGGLVTAEPAINLPDGKLYVKDSGGAVKQVAPSMTEHNTKANSASPTFTGTPAAPTATADDTSTLLATTAFVVGQASTTNPAANGAVAIGTSKKFARADHVHPTDTTRAALASPTFTGTPAAPTAAVGTNTTQLATTAFVKAALDVLVAAAPGTLDTLNELAAALGNDPNFATTMAAAIGAKSAEFDAINGGSF
jgi:hypothetical protein